MLYFCFCVVGVICLNTEFVVLLQKNPQFHKCHSFEYYVQY